MKTKIFSFSLLLFMFLSGVICFAGTSREPSSTLPAQYVVRPWVHYGDSLLTIAGQPWAYNDPTMWRLIYEANKDKMPEPGNPNLIPIGMVLDIPSINGEVREGMWTETGVNISYQNDTIEREDITTSIVNGYSSALDLITLDFGEYYASIRYYEGTVHYTMPSDVWVSLQLVIDEVIVSRNDALAAGAGYLAPDYFLEIDNFSLEALAQLESGNYFYALDSGIKILQMYRTLTVGVEAYKLRMEIEERDFFDYDPVNISIADDIALSALYDFELGNIKAVTMKANDVLARYGQSLNIAEQAFALYQAASVEYQAAYIQLPAHYTVRCWEQTGDSLWNIAAHPLVYNDPYQWRLLYEANRDKMPEPGNPDLILIGMVLDIPSINGEVREGLWVEDRSDAIVELSPESSSHL